MKLKTHFLFSLGFVTRFPLVFDNTRHTNFIISILINNNMYNIYSIYHFVDFFVTVFTFTRFGMFIRVKFLNSSITMTNWWSQSVNNLLINFKTSILLLKWIILEYICSYWWSILNTTMMIVLVFSQIFHKELMNCTQTFKSTTKSIFTSIIRFPEILSFLLGDEDNEGVWETENV